MNEHKIKEIIIETLEEFNQFIDNLILTKENDFDVPHDINIIDIHKKDQHIYYRGHSREDYKLKSTLERKIEEYLKTENISRNEYNKIINDYLSYCKEFLIGKISEQYILLDEKFNNEVWAVGQHFGLKTPFLDWTHSFWIALFFAFRDSPIHGEKYRVVYSLNNFFHNREIKIIRPKLDIGGRINAQQGVFTDLLYYELLALDKESEIKLPSINNTEYKSTILTKIKINSKLRNKIMEFMNKMNINNTTLFPDITGAILDCHLQLENILEIKSLSETDNFY